MEASGTVSPFPETGTTGVRLLPGPGPRKLGQGRLLSLDLRLWPLDLVTASDNITCGVKKRFTHVVRDIYTRFMLSTFGDRSVKPVLFLVSEDTLIQSSLWPNR
jgi:hypothetical protein